MTPISSHLIFDWDEQKNKTNIQKHSLDFLDAGEAFRGKMVEWVSLKQDYGEERRVALGMLRDVHVVVVYTLRNGKIRIISFRKAKRNERKIYQTYSESNRLEPAPEHD